LGRTMGRIFPILFILAIFTFSYIVPYSVLEALPLCPIQTFIGWDCPTCGLTRAFCLFFKGNLRQALLLNGMVPVMVLWLGIYLCEHLYAIFYGIRPPWFTQRGNKIIAPLLIVLLMGQWLWKSTVHLRGLMG